MFVGSKWVRKMATPTVVALLIVQVLIGCTDAATKCHKCTGINCQRTSYTTTEDCVDALDSCTTIFQGSTVLAQGCFGQLAVELRNKCQTPTNTNEDNVVAMEGEELQTTNAACYQCREDLCNDVSGEAFGCIQCDSNADGNCASGTANLQPAKCPIARSVNSYCYTKVEGKRAIRGCATSLVQQKECLNNNDCVLCSPLDISGCNRDPKISTDDNGSGSESGGSGNGTNSGTSDGDSNICCGVLDNGTGTGDGGSSSGGGNGGGSGTGDGDAGSGGGGGGGGGGGNGDGSGNGTGAGDGGSSSGGGGGNNSGSDSGTGSGTDDGGSNSGNSGSGTGSGGSDNGTGSGNDTTDSGINNTSGAMDISNYKLFTTVIFILLALLKF